LPLALVPDYLDLPVYRKAEKAEEFDDAEHFRDD
jgi:hypothetical protein